MREEHQVGPLNNCISELQQQTHAQRLELQDAQYGFLESRREQVRLQEEPSMKGKGSPRYSDPKCAQNGRNEESSRTTNLRSLRARMKRKS